ncbi:MAG: SUMF1/EgtB/PvdO family nonheme iron enzyme [Gammaproteobacteria bacterium]|nr:SUMF1/EgtB/PvdO family nonheme iron enzyme [Gammaproteobacteria bacterium]
MKHSTSKASTVILPPAGSNTSKRKWYYLVGLGSLSVALVLFLIIDSISDSNAQKAAEALLQETWKVREHAIASGADKSPQSKQWLEAEQWLESGRQMMNARDWHSGQELLRRAMASYQRSQLLLDERARVRSELDTLLSETLAAWEKLDRAGILAHEGVAPSLTSAEQSLEFAVVQLERSEFLAHRREIVAALKSAQDGYRQAFDEFQVYKQSLGRRIARLKSEVTAAREAARNAGADTSMMAFREAEEAFSLVSDSFREETLLLHGERWVSILIETRKLYERSRRDALAQAGLTVPKAATDAARSAALAAGASLEIEAFAQAEAQWEEANSLLYAENDMPDVLDQVLLLMEQARSGYDSALAQTKQSLDPLFGDDAPRFVTIDGSLAFGIHEITRAQYAVFALATGRNETEPGKCAEPRCPVTFVTWLEAREFADWLSERTGENYRLPTESEWDRVANQAGQAIPFWRTLDEACRYANLFDRTAKGVAGASNITLKHDCDDTLAGVSPVALLEADSKGIYDRYGNVWEMMCSRFEGPAGDCVAADDEEKRVIRGGSAESTIEGMMRNWIYRDERLSDVGFRLIREK